GEKGKYSCSAPRVPTGDVERCRNARPLENDGEGRRPIVTSFSCRPGRCCRRPLHFSLLADCLSWALRERRPWLAQPQPSPLPGEPFPWSVPQRLVSSLVPQASSPWLARLRPSPWQELAAS